MSEILDFFHVNRDFRFLFTPTYNIFLNNFLLNLAIPKIMWIFKTPDFNSTNNIVRISNFDYSFVDVNVGVSWCNNSIFVMLSNGSKPGINESNKKIIFIFLVLTSSLFLFADKIKRWCEY